MMYDYQNVGYQMPSAPYPMTQANFGGYPAGYPPVASPQGYGMQMNPIAGQIPMMTGYGNNIVPTSPQMAQSMTAQYCQNGAGPDFSMPVPGVTSPLELEFSDGSKTVIPPSQQPQMSTGYTQGGARVSQGGFNPLNGVTTPAIGNQGFNPYYDDRPNPVPMQQPAMPGFQMNGMMIQNMLNQVQNGPSQQLIGNPGYMTPGQTPQRMPNPSNFGMGFAPYSPPGVDPYAFNQPWARSPMGMFPFQGQNMFNYTLQDFLYEEQPSAIDAKAMLAEVVLTDEERERIGQIRNEIIGYDYYSRPIYSASGYYRQSVEKQQQFEEARHQYQSYFTHLSRIAHAYSGEKIDEEAMMKRFDPVPTPPPPPKVFNPMTATDEERRNFARDQMAANAIMLDNIASSYEMNMRSTDLYRQNLYAQVKASHDRLIGVQPGEHYDLKTFMDNGYKIGVDIAMRKAKSANRNGTTKYSRNGFRANMNANPRSINQAQVPITSTDDEYVSVEEMLKSVYNRNKTRMYQNVQQLDESQLTLVRDKDGRISYTNSAGAMSNPNVDSILNPNSSEREAHMFFLESLQKKKNIDEVRQGLR